jgi:hypothetical protein
MTRLRGARESDELERWHDPLVKEFSSTHSVWFQVGGVKMQKHMKDAQRLWQRAHASSILELVLTTYIVPPNPCSRWVGRADFWGRMALPI